MTETSDITTRLCEYASGTDSPPRMLLVRAATEIARLRLAIQRLADQDATLSVCDGDVTVTMEASPEWIPVAERLPEIPPDAPNYACRVNVLTWNSMPGWSVREMVYARNMYAKTEKGRDPRWEEVGGRLAHFQPTHWMPMPPGPPCS
jgi:hypothetical protein